MSLNFTCECGRLLEVGDELAGKRVRCPACQRIVTAPEAPPIPEARLVDPPQAAVPVAAVAPQTAAPAPAPAAAAEAPACASGGCPGLAVAGFVVAFGSLVFGVATTSGLFTWMPVGLVAAAISYAAVRRVRAGQAPVESLGLARAGLVIGLGQALLAAALWIGIAGVGCHTGRGGDCIFSREFRCKESRRAPVRQEVDAPQKVAPPAEEKRGK
jgi:hypothetical protein